MRWRPLSDRTRWRFLDTMDYWHVVKFRDGTYLTPRLTYESRQRSQCKAQPWLTWACAKMIAQSPDFAGRGARAVRVVRRMR